MCIPCPKMSILSSNWHRIRRNQMVIEQLSSTLSPIQTQQQKTPEFYKLEMANQASSMATQSTKVAPRMLWNSKSLKSPKRATSPRI
ncbi:hypothetical protein FGO68_gene5329 [Halteria grandinella]|uniref:Uncharacterized protein n=1 Tax=Halteria grandinella TaxID=5974 RepID=A0A8J8NSL8_HALGN|nr:hypothetical protein FGO68_gene5329 [Halteria grandinella]